MRRGKSTERLVILYVIAYDEERAEVVLHWVKKAARGHEIYSFIIGSTS